MGFLGEFVKIAFDKPKNSKKSISLI